MTFEPAQLVLAAHEAGHAIVAKAMTLRIVAIRMTYESGGVSIRYPRNPSPNMLRAILWCYVAGDLAEEMLVDAETRSQIVGPKWTDYASDGYRIDHTLNALGGDPYQQLEEARDVARLILLDNWRQLVAVRDELLVNHFVDPASNLLAGVHFRADAIIALMEARAN